MALGYNSTTPLSAEIHSSLLFPSSLSHHLEAQSKAVQAAALKEPGSSRAAADPVALLGKNSGSAHGCPSVPAPALPKSLGSSGTAAPECSVPPRMASHSSGYLCEGRHQTGLASTQCAARHKNCKLEVNLSAGRLYLGSQPRQPSSLSLLDAF